MKSPEPPNTHLSGRRLGISRATWVIIFLLNVIVFSVSTPGWFGEIRKDYYNLQEGLNQLGISVDSFAYYGTVIEVILALALITIAVVNDWQKSDDWMGLLVSMGQFSKDLS